MGNGAHRKAPIFKINALKHFLGPQKSFDVSFVILNLKV